MNNREHQSEIPTLSGRVVITSSGNLAQHFPPRTVITLPHDRLPVNAADVSVFPLLLTDYLIL